MNPFVIKTLTTENYEKNLDELLIPNEIYDDTINRNKLIIQKYFIDNPLLMTQFIGFNSKLKMAGVLSSDRKCGCFYTVPWITKYAADNNLEKTILLFNQQVGLYKYMLQNWYGENTVSYMRYLSYIALDLIQQLKRALYNMNNNLEYKNIFNQPWNNWNTNLDFILYIRDLKLL